MPYRALNRIRQILQVLTLLFLLALPLLVWRGYTFLLGNFYGMTIAGLDIVDPVMAIQVLILSRAFFGRLLIAAIIPVLLALLLGKLFCSWVCPQNTFSEWSDAVRQRVARRRRRRAKQAPVGNPARLVFWGIFAVLIAAVLFTGWPLLSYLSMPGIISAQISQLVLSMGLGLELGLVLAVLVLEYLLGKRFWCKYVCPVGAGLSLFKGPWTLRVRHEPASCHCLGEGEMCSRACPLDLKPTRPGIYPFCSNCGLCLEACEQKGGGALSFRFGIDRDR